MSPERTVKALRGAITVATNDPGEIVAATEEVLRRLLNDNEVDVADVISIFFTSTPDLTAEFPAAAARAIGLGEVALMCGTEIDVPGSLPRCVRVMMHLYTSRAYSDLRHAYLGEARRLRTDLSGDL